MTKFRMKLASLLILSFSVFSSFGQVSSDSITREQGLEDLNIFSTSLREIHPNIYRYTSKADFVKAYAKVAEQIGATITVKQFYNLVSPIITMVRCGHTFGFVSLVDDKRGLLPLDVKIIDDKLFVLRNFSPNSELAAGSELLAINDIPAADLLKDFRAKQNADAFGVTFKDRIIERDFRWKFATFVDQPDSFEIEFNEYNTKARKRLTLAAISNESVSQELEKSEMPNEKPLVFFVDTKNSIASLKVGSFMAKSIRKQHGQHLRQVIKKSFKQLYQSGIDNLIIDLRGNTGGKVFATPLIFSYLTDKEFKVANKIVFRHGYKFTYPQHLNRDKFSDWVNSKLDKKINDTTYEWTLHRITRKTFKPKKNSFKGNVYVIINGMTASAGTEFASIVRAHNKAIFVGEETGGDFNGVNGFERTYVRLPNSGIGILIAGWRSKMAWGDGKDTGHGVVPDFELHPTVQDLLTGQDAEMNFTYELIRKGAEK